MITKVEVSQKKTMPGQTRVPEYAMPMVQCHDLAGVCTTRHRRNSPQIEPSAT